MPILAPEDTLRALGGPELKNCDSRSLFLDRFADPQAKEDSRRRWFATLIGKKTASLDASNDWLPAQADRVYARLGGRLMLNMAGGVMENANLLLDRYGLPVIPGSAVKGCARRMALQALHDWVEAGTKQPSAEDLGAPCCKDFGTPAEMLAAIACVFGFVEKDWESGKKDGLYRSDFGWACGEAHEEIWTAASKELAKQFSWGLAESRPWEHLPSLAGSIAFLAARPNRDPGLELDVLTPHHKAYYEGGMPVATDTEDPVPVFFPAIRPQGERDYFTFPIFPLGHNGGNHLAKAKTWLAIGLATFGLGAKTNAGYGWFDASDNLQVMTQRRIDERRQAVEYEQKQEEENRRRLAEEHQRRLIKEEEDKATAGMTKDQMADWRVARLTDAQFGGKITSFPSLEKAEQQAIVRALRGARVSIWREFKGTAEKGRKAQIADAIRAVSRELGLGKMP